MKIHIAITGSSNSGITADAAVRSEKIGLVYKNTPAAILGTVMAVLITWLIFARLIPFRALLLWSIAVMGALYIRYMLYRRFLRTSNSA